LISAIRHVLGFGRRSVHNLSTEARAGLFGLGWSYLSHGVQLVLRLGSSLILTRLLAPDAYGIFGPALAVIFLLDMLCDLGVQQSVIRSPIGETPEFLGTARSLLLVRAIPLTLAVAALAFVLPPFYDLPELFGVLLVLSVRPLLLSQLNPTLFVLYRHLNYRTPFRLDVLQLLFSIPMTIVLAWQLPSEWSVWSLVIGLLFGDAVRVVLSHILCPRVPGFRWDAPSARELSRFGFSILRNTIVYGAWIYFDRLAGPRLLGPEKIGLYVLAWTLAEGLELLISRGSDVFYSMLARRDEADRTPFFQRTARRVALYLLPLLFVGAMLAPLVFKLIYPAKFHGSAVLLGLLIVRLIMRATSQIQFMHLMMRAEVYIATRAYIASFIVLVATFVVWVEVLGLGVVGLAVSAVVAMTTFTLTQTLQLVWRKELSPWPAIAGLLWTGVGMAGVLLVYGTG